MAKSEVSLTKSQVEAIASGKTTYKDLAKDLKVHHLTVVAAYRKATGQPIQKRGRRGRKAAAGSWANAEAVLASLREGLASFTEEERQKVKEGFPKLLADIKEAQKELETVMVAFTKLTPAQKAAFKSRLS
jgi:DNA-binding MarR family transcriptional regulator